MIISSCFQIPSFTNRVKALKFHLTKKESSDLQVFIQSSILSSATASVSDVINSMWFAIILCLNKFYGIVICCQTLLGTVKYAQIISNCHKIGDDALVKLNKVSIQSFGGICPNSLTKSTFEVHFWEQILGMEMLYNLR